VPPTPNVAGTAMTIETLTVIDRLLLGRTGQGSNIRGVATDDDDLTVFQTTYITSMGVA